MKSFVLSALFMASLSTAALAQDGSKDIQTETIKVKGTCGQCKKRIENAAYVPGVKRAEWDKSSKELVVTYKPSKTSLEKIEKSIAGTGHDAGSITASDTAYNKLPECCAYKHDHADH